MMQALLNLPVLSTILTYKQWQSVDACGQCPSSCTPSALEAWDHVWTQRELTCRVKDCSSHILIHDGSMGWSHKCCCRERRQPLQACLPVNLDSRL